MSTQRDECFKALRCLYIAVDQSVARDVELKVIGYISELEKEKQRSDVERLEYMRRAITAEVEVKTLREQAAAAKFGG